MRFPLRLSAALFHAKFSRLRTACPVFRLSLLIARVPDSSPDVSLSAENVWRFPEDCIRLARTQGSPVVWLGGGEPMFHPAIGDVASSLVRSGLHVFVHTCGHDFRKRIHEFTPDSRLFFVFEFAGREAEHDRSAGEQGRFQSIMEAIRAAKLSGFLVCAHVSVNPRTDPCEIGELFEYLDSRDVDGFIVSSGGVARSSAEAAAVHRTLHEVLCLARSRRWEGFSRLLEASYATHATAPSPSAELRGPEANACEESA